MYNLTDADKNFIATYDVEKFDRPSVAIDTVILCLNERFELMVLTTKRDEQPFYGKLQLPGGFVDTNKDLDDQVKDIVRAKTGFNSNIISFEQLYTYGKVDRDPRTRVISVTYFAILPQNALYNETAYCKDLSGAGWIHTDSRVLPLAFDHNEILQDAIERIANKIDYTDIAFEFLKSKDHFTLFELKKVYEELGNCSFNIANFRRDILKRYGDRLEVIEGIESTEFSKRPSKVYRLK